MSGEPLGFFAAPANAVVVWPGQLEDMDTVTGPDGSLRTADGHPVWVIHTVDGPSDRSPAEDATLDGTT